MLPLFMKQNIPMALGVLVCLASFSFAQEQAAPQQGVSSGVEGTLVICGGGRLPDEVMEEFVAAAGGKKARLVVVPTASSLADRLEPEWFLAPWRSRGVASVTLLHTRDREKANQESFVTPLRQATAVWFYGGYQSRLSDTYVGTRFEQELYALLHRGGVVGGTSAGAAAMSRRMIVRGRTEPELGVGFDLLPDAVIDQHFLRRNRKPRLQAAVAKAPGCFGVGIDEGTALVVHGGRARVVGESVVTVCMPSSPRGTAKELTLERGAATDLLALRRTANGQSAAPLPPLDSQPVVRSASLPKTSGEQNLGE
jgi:cyanophycinase